MNTPTRLAAGLAAAAVISIAPPSFHFHSWSAHADYTQDFSRNVGVFQRDVGRSNEMDCRAENVKRVGGKLRIWATAADPCGRVSTKGFAAFGGPVLDIRARVKVRIQKGDGGWVIMDTFRTGDPCKGETSGPELVQGTHYNVRNHTCKGGKRFSGTTAGKWFPIDMSGWHTIRTVIEPSQISWFVDGRRIFRETRAEHVAGGGTWEGAVSDASRTKVLPRYAVFAVRAGGAKSFGGPITRPRKISLAVDTVRVITH